MEYSVNPHCKINGSVICSVGNKYILIQLERLNFKILHLKYKKCCCRNIIVTILLIINPIHETPI